MKKIGLMILGGIVLGAILVMTLVMEVLEFFIGAISFILVAVLLIIVYNKIKDTVS